MITCAAKEILAHCNFDRVFSVEKLLKGTDLGGQHPSLPPSHSSDVSRAGPLKRTTAMPAKSQLHGTSHVRVRLALFLSSFALVSSPNLLRRRQQANPHRMHNLPLRPRPSVWLSVPRDSRKYAKSRCRSSLLTLSFSFSRLPSLRSSNMAEASPWGRNTCRLGDSEGKEAIFMVALRVRRKEDF